MQDGEVPVVVVNQRHRAPEETRAAMADLERALSHERDARSNAEKALAQAEETIRQLRTRLAHAEIARDEVAAAPPLPASPVPPLPESALAVLDEMPVPAPKRGRPRKIRSADDVSNASAETATVETAGDGEDVGGDAIEWWRPGWRERLRKAQ